MKDKIKILLAASSSSTYSGASWSLISLAKCLIKDGYNTEIILFSKGSIENMCIDEGIQYTIIKHFRDDWISGLDDCKKSLIDILKLFLKRIYNVYALKKTHKFIVNNSFDIVHINALTDGLIAKAAKKAGVKLVWHIREFLEEDLSRKFCNPSLAVELINSSSAIIAISNAIKSKYDKIFSKDIRVIYNGIDVNRFYQERNILLNEDVVICIVGRIDPGKGQDQLIKACTNLLDNGYNLSIRIIGKNQYPDYYSLLNRRIEESGYKDRFIFIDHTDKIEKEYCKADIMCVCSKKEAFGRVTVEGMISGLFVIGSNTGGTKELIEDGVSGYLYEEGNIESLTLTIKKTIDNKIDSQKISKNAQKRAAELFSVNKNALMIENIYREIIQD